VITKLCIEAALPMLGQAVVLDVRSPAEYAHAHLPQAQPLPLFTNEERAIIGTLYKQHSREKAIKAGLGFFGPKMPGLVEQVEALEQAQRKKLALGKGERGKLLVHCWRGGLRSAAVAWLLDLYGFQVYTLVGGYKAYRRWALQQFDRSYNFQVLGGCTGSGKTAILQHLQKSGCAVIDLEGLAGHKGSAFGNIGLPAQPSQEHFENALALQLFLKSQMDLPIFIEDESQRIGTVNLPTALYAHMRGQPLWFLQVPFHERLSYLVADYGRGDVEALINAIVRIKKRLGGLEAKTAINHLLEGDLHGCFGILLQYYDKWYTKNIHSLRPQADLSITNIDCADTRVEQNAQLVLTAVAKRSLALGGF
jgi:tRNA 2-selenouridine synthase